MCIRNSNTDKVIEAKVQVENGRVKYDGDFAIAGVPGTAAPIKLSFIDPMGSVTGKLLPTGNASDVLDIPGFGQVEVSIAVSYTHLDVYKRQEQYGRGSRNSCQIPIVRTGTSDFDYIVDCPQRQKKFPHCGAKAPQRGNFVECNDPLAQPAWICGNRKHSD